MTTEQAAAYLPYGLVFSDGHWLSGVVNLPREDYGKRHNTRQFLLSEEKGSEIVWEAHSEMLCKPILHPPSDITKPITVNGDSFVPLDQIMSHDIVAGMLLENGCKISNLPYWVVENLISWHIDIFNLIESGQAIDVNTLETNPYA